MKVQKTRWTLWIITTRQYWKRTWTSSNWREHTENIQERTSVNYDQTVLKRCKEKCQGEKQRKHRSTIQFSILFILLILFGAKASSSLHRDSGVGRAWWNSSDKLQALQVVPDACARLREMYSAKVLFIPLLKQDTLLKFSEIGLLQPLWSPFRNFSLKCLEVRKATCDPAVSVNYCQLHQSGSEFTFELR